MRRKRAAPACPAPVQQVAEFTVNEQPADSFNAPQRRGYEQLLRKLLKIRSCGEQGGDGNGAGSSSSERGSAGCARIPPPAVLVLHHYGWWISNVDDASPAGNYFDNNEAQLHTFSNVSSPRAAAPRRGAFFQGRVQGTPGSVRGGARRVGLQRQRLLAPRRRVPTVFAALPRPPPLPQYYDLPSVSIRNGLWPLMQAGLPGFRVDKVRGGAWWRCVFEVCLCA